MYNYKQRGGAWANMTICFFKVFVRIINELSDEVSIQLGVGQGCVASPTLSNLSTENLFKHIINMNDVNAGETKYNNLRHADDTPFLAGNEHNPSEVITKINEEEKQLVMKFQDD